MLTFVRFALHADDLCVVVRHYFDRRVVVRVHLIVAPPLSMPSVHVQTWSAESNLRLSVSPENNLRLLVRMTFVFRRGQQKAT